MADKKISQLTELTTVDPSNDLLVIVDFNTNETKKVKIEDLPYEVSEITFFALTDESTSSKRVVGSLDAADIPGVCAYVQIGNSVTSIGNGAFLNNSLTSVTIPSSTFQHPPQLHHHPLTRSSAGLLGWISLPGRSRDGREVGKKTN